MLLKGPYFSTLLQYIIYMFDRLIASLEYTHKFVYNVRITQNNNFDTELNTVMFS